MTIREAVRSDFQAIGEVCAAAFMDEELYGGLKHPHRQEYPDDFISYFSYKAESHWLDHTRVILVSIDNDSGRIVGFADWQRQGKRLPPLREKSDPRHPKNSLNDTFHQNAAAFHNRAADLTKLDILEDSFELVSHFWSGAREENWFLDLLAVHPNFEGKGHGRSLTQWGIDEAKKEGITTSVVSADQKDGFYKNLGFLKFGMANVGPLGENGMRGGVIMFIDI